jgi:hypothetical protein
LVNQLNNGFLNLNLHKSFIWSINLPPFKVEGCCKHIGKLTETGKVILKVILKAFNTGDCLIEVTTWTGLTVLGIQKETLF